MLKNPTKLHKVQIEEYTNDEISINYSKLKDLSISPLLYKSKYIDKKEQEKKSFLDLGSIVHCLLLCPELFDSYYVVGDIKESEAIDKLVTEMMKTYKLDDLTFLSKDQIYDHLITLVLELEIFNNIKKKETFVKKFEEIKILETVQLRLTYPDKTIINENLFQTAVRIAEGLEQNSFTKEYFNTNKDSIVHLNEFAIFWEYEGLKCKSLIDKLIIDHEKSTILPIDLKTTAYSTSDFSKSVLKFRYDLQCAFYYKAIYEWMQTTPYAEYELLPFKYIVESTTYPGSPLIYDFKQITTKGVNGFKKDDKYYKGYIELIKELQWHYDTDLWNYSYDNYKNKGNILLELD